MVDIPNYFERAVALLASQFQLTNPNGALTNLQKLLAGILTEAQQLNTQEQALQTQRYLNTAVGAQLDGLGQILGLARVPGQTDASYREDLQFQIFFNQSNGTPEEMITIIAFLTDASRVFYSEIYPAAYQLTTNGLTFPINPSDLFNLMQNVSPAGVAFVALIATYNTNPFSFSTDPIFEQFYVNTDLIDPNGIHPLQVNPGTGNENFSIQKGATENPDFGGHFAEALGQYPSYTIDSDDAGRMTEVIQFNGNLPPPR